MRAKKHTMDNRGSDPTPRKPFQFGLLDLLAITLWAAIVLAAWRTGLSQPMLMPIIIPVGAAIVVYAGLIAARRYTK
jgi:hypothetical protein